MLSSLDQSVSRLISKVEMIIISELTFLLSLYARFSSTAILPFGDKFSSQVVSSDPPYPPISFYQ